jgi:hypothetical protein
VAEAISTARQAGATGTIVVRADSAYFAVAFVAESRRNGAHFSVTVRMDPKVKHAITGIADDAWTTINYPNAIHDEATDTWISDAEIAEVPCTVRLQAGAPHRRQPDRAAGEAAEPQGRRAGRSRAVRHLAVSRAVHRHW